MKQTESEEEIQTTEQSQNVSEKDIPIGGSKDYVEVVEPEEQPCNEVTVELNDEVEENQPYTEVNEPKSGQPEESEGEIQQLDEQEAKENAPAEFSEEVVENSDDVPAEDSVPTMELLQNQKLVKEQQQELEESKEPIVNKINQKINPTAITESREVKPETLNIRIEKSVPRLSFVGVLDTTSQDSDKEDDMSKYMFV